MKKLLNEQPIPSFVSYRPLPPIFYLITKRFCPISLPLPLPIFFLSGHIITLYNLCIIFILSIPIFYFNYFNFFLIAVDYPQLLYSNYKKGAKRNELEEDAAFFALLHLYSDKGMKDACELYPPIFISSLSPPARSAFLLQPHVFTHARIECFSLYPCFFIFFVYYFVTDLFF